MVHRAEAGALLASGLGDPANTVLVWSADDLTGRLPFLVDGPGSAPAPAASVQRLHRELVVDGTIDHAVAPVQLSDNARLVATNPDGVTHPRRHGNRRQRQVVRAHRTGRPSGRRG